MTMPHYFVSENLQQGGEYDLPSELVHHLFRVLRKRPGDEIRVCDGESGVHLCRIESLSEKVGQFSVLSSEQKHLEPPYRIMLFQGLAKGDKMDRLIQQCVELGMTDFYAFDSAYSQVHLREEKTMAKIERWQKIADSASEQCARGQLPRIHQVMSFAEMKQKILEAEYSFFAYEREEAQSLPELLRERQNTIPSSIAFVVGPEGGFSDSEARELAEIGVHSVTLGPRILRTESAAPCVLSMLMGFWELSSS